jgi:hypothetical protein
MPSSEFVNSVSGKIDSMQSVNRFAAGINYVVRSIRENAVWIALVMMALWYIKDGMYGVGGVALP